ncbi:TonB family protein [Duganella sp. LX20W]|uniref:TonB family protein n=1 Tax=Rugamonas brunnea TaxID=2758569 RepID=A0A7W2ICH3_9BURK|nr:energy transducer TonB [Rugamonas brunnea]MBA5638561.1 TonB family protein [Rugamonas brunnea]
MTNVFKKIVRTHTYRLIFFLSCSSTAMAAAHAAAEPIDAAIASAGVALNAACTPQWPNMQTDLRGGGKTRLTVVVDEKGEVSQSKLDASSGQNTLDEAVRTAAEKCKFTPLLQDGIPVKHSFIIRYSWMPGQTPAPLRARATCEKPKYPEAARRREQQGTVTMKFLIGVDGSVLDAKIAQSSGFPLLDEAALAGVAKCPFEAAMVDGKPEQTWMQVKYAWTLQ